jgi:integrase
MNADSQLDLQTDQSALPSVGAIVAQIQNDPSVPAWRRKSVGCTLRCLSRHLHRNVAGMPVEPAQLRDLLARFNPVRAGVGCSRRATLRNDLSFICRYAGRVMIPSRSTTPLTPDWKSYLSQIDNRSDRMALGRLARFCVDTGINPGEVDDGVMSRYGQLLEAQSLARRPRTIYRNTINAWNRAVDACARWPARKLGLPENPATWTLPLETFPASFQADVESYLYWMGGSDLFNERGPRRACRPATLLSRRNDIRTAASALVAQGRDPTMITGLADLVEPQAAETILRHLYDRDLRNDTKNTHQLALALKLVARDWLQLDGAIVDRLAEYVRRLRAPQRGMTDKNRERLRPFDDPRHVLKLLHFPQDELRRVRARDQGTRREALRVQIALAVEILLIAPIRRENLAAIHIDRHLSWTRGGRRGTVHLVIPGEETKNGEPLEFELSAETARLLTAYLEDYRPRLTGDEAGWLFPGKGVRHKTAGALASQIKRSVHAGTGLVMNAHLFRHLAAKLSLDDHPGGYEVVRRVLGHRSLQTTVNAYCGTETAAATRHFDNTILKLREAPTLSARGRSA